MNKNKELAKNTIIITLGKVCTQFIGFLLLPFYTTLLSTEQYGTVDLLQTYVQLLLPIVLFQIDQAVFRFLIDKRNNSNEKNQLVSSAIFFVCIQMICFSIIYLIVSRTFNIKYGMYLYFNIIFSALSSVLLQISRGIGNNIVYAIGSLLSGSINVVLNVILIAFAGMRADGMMLANIIANAMCSLYIFLKGSVTTNG